MYYTNTSGFTIGDTFRLRSQRPVSLPGWKLRQECVYWRPANQQMGCTLFISGRRKYPPPPGKKNLLTNFVRFRFGTHVSGAPSVQRSLRINNTGPYGELMENCYRAYAHDATAAILVFQNNETAAMLVCKTNPVRVELFSCVNTFFVPRNLHDCWTSEFIRFIGLVDMWFRGTRARWSTCPVNVRVCFALWESSWRASTDW